MEHNASHIQLVPLPATVVPDWWESVRDMVDDACSHSQGKYHISDVLTHILTKRMQLWVAMDKHEISAIGITELVQYPQIKVCRVLAVTGEHKDLWIKLIDEMEAWGRSVGAEDMELVCRPGWEREMKKYGYEKTHVILNKRLGYVH